jgi:hypothetical protein
MGRVSVTINNYKMVDFSMQYMMKNVNLKKLLYYIVPQSSELLITFGSTVIVA